MRTAVSMIALSVVLAATCGSPGSGHAAEPVAPGAAFKVVDTDVLAEQRGGTDTHLSEITAVGTVSEVHAYDLVTGHNIVSEGALSGASGMPMLIQNTGNGVLIQNATILNLQVQ